MSGTVSLPPGLNMILAGLVRGAGETVVFVPETGPQISVRASVQSPMVDPLYGDASQEGFLVFVSPLDIPQEPDKFERIIIRGNSRTISACHATELNGVVLMWMLRVMG